MLVISKLHVGTRMVLFIIEVFHLVLKFYYALYIIS